MQPVIRDPIVDGAVVPAMMRGPDFLCIGQQKAATTWLYDQLQFHPEFWMPPVKELHYFSGQFPHRKTLMEIDRVDGSQQKIERWQRRRVELKMRPLAERDLQFLQLAKSYQGKAPDLERYAALFSFKGSQFSGDISPSYANLSFRQIEDIAAFFPALRIILIVREPIERAWSDINVDLRNGRIDEGVISDAELFAAHIAAFGTRYFGTRIARNWLEHFPPERLLCVLYDELVADPVTTRAAILTFLGASTAAGDLPAGFDRKRGAPKRSMLELNKDALVRHFAEELLLSAEMFGSAAVAWRLRYETLTRQSATQERVRSYPSVDDRLVVRMGIWRRQFRVQRVGPSREFAGSVLAPSAGPHGSRLSIASREDRCGGGQGPIHDSVAVVALGRVLGLLERRG
ncbi:MAG: sulfotransferase [Enhydrobacter sp.]|nr:sulfotransferase [Enhydrobacter sp.]